MLAGTLSVRLHRAPRQQALAAWLDDGACTVCCASTNALVLLACLQQPLQHGLFPTYVLAYVARS
jgi:hypothetical protein